MQGIVFAIVNNLFSHFGANELHQPEAMQGCALPAHGSAGASRSGRRRRNVGHNAVAAFVHAKLLAQVGDGSVNMAQQCSVRFGKLCRRFNMLLGDYQKMHRCLRVNIIKCQQSVILIQLIGRDLARCDLSKQAVIHRFCPFPGCGAVGRHPNCTVVL